MFVLSLFLILAPGCIGHPNSSLNEAEQADQALMDAYTALGTDDEEIQFGDDEISQVASQEESVTDAYAPTEEQNADQPSTPDCEVYSLLIRWGQLTGINRDVSDATDWSGTFSANVGTLSVMKKVAFDKNDELLSRTDPKIIGFTSHTKPHFDGLRVRYEVCDADKALLGSGEEASLTFGAPGASMTKSYNVDELADLNDLVENVNSHGDRFHALSVKKSDLCQGTVEGRWIERNDQYGIFKGIVVSTNGLPVGYVRGFFGQRDGEKKLVAKMISSIGHFGGIIQGSYDDANQITAQIYNRNKNEIGHLEGSFTLAQEFNELGTFSANYTLDCAENLINE